MNISPAVKIKLLLWFTTATITPLHLHLIQIECPISTCGILTGSSGGLIITAHKNSYLFFPLSNST